jgi:hypothetical protein
MTPPCPDQNGAPDGRQKFTRFRTCLPACPMGSGWRGSKSAIVYPRQWRDVCGSKGLSTVALIPKRPPAGRRDVPTTAELSK